MILLLLFDISWSTSIQELIRLVASHLQHVSIFMCCEFIKVSSKFFVIAITYIGLKIHNTFL